MIIKKLCKFRDNIAVKYQRKFYTYKDIDRLSDIVCCFIQKVQIGNKLICIAFTNVDVNLIVTIFGVLKSGENMILLNKNSKSYKYKLDRLSPKIVIDTENDSMKNSIDYNSVINFVKNNRLTCGIKKNINLDNNFLTVFTSGSTGEPKIINCKYGTIDTYINFLETNYKLQLFQLKLDKILY